MTMFNFECSVCHTCNASKLLPCLHTICELCLEQRINRHADTGIFKCKQCSTNIQIPKSGSDGLKTLAIDGITNSAFSHLKTCHPVDATDFEKIKVSTLGDKEISGASQTSDLDCPVSGVVNGEIYGSSRLESNSYSDGRASMFSSNMLFERYCFTCDMLLCSKCCEDRNEHEKHNVILLQSFVKLKTEFITQMLVSAKTQLEDQSRLTSSRKHISSSLEESLTRIKCDIIDRAEKLCALIAKKKNALIQNIDEIINTQRKFYQEKQEYVEHTGNALKDAMKFSEFVISEGNAFNLMNLHNDISSRLSLLVQQAKDTLKLLNVNLDIPDNGKTELYVDKLYGTLVQGDILCGDADLLTTFKCDLSWPCDIAVTKSSDYLICGKLGAFQRAGRAVSYNKIGHCNFKYELPITVLPRGICVSACSEIYMATSDGAILHLASNGILVKRWPKCFQGVGNIAEYNDHIYITSSDEKCIKVFDLNGENVEIIKPICSTSIEEVSPCSIAISCCGLLAMTSLHSSSIFFLDRSGNVKFEYCDVESIKCPSAIQFDKFGNLLVADFTSDCVHILSSAGWYFGKLLTKNHGISCPNAMAFDNEGHLLIGQYGGDVQIVRYMSLEKQL